MKYLLDANVFIEAKNRYYGFDFCPAFWDWLKDNQATICSIDKVKKELLDKKDEVTEWVKEDSNHLLFKPFGETPTVHFSAINQWIRAQKNYRQIAIQEFQGNTDYYLIAYAKEHGLVVVTHEVSTPNSEKVIKIPDVCNALGVECTNTFDMLKEEKARFVHESLH